MSTFVDRSVENVKPGSVEWLGYMSASKIAAVMGHSEYDSYFSLWHRMNGSIQPEPEDDVKKRGHYLEPAIAAWFQDQHPDWEIRETGMWINPDCEWQAASPDRIILTPEGPRLLQCKSDASHEYGEPGTDQIPVGYFDQVQWEMHVTGIHICHLAVISSYLVFEEYVIEYNPEYVAGLVAKAEPFMLSLLAGQKPSIDPMDGHTATYRAVRELHPEIDGSDYELTTEQATAFLAARAAKKEAEELEQAAKSVIADAMGAAKTASWNGAKLFNRQSKGGGTPYLVAAKNLPSIETQGVRAA